MDEQVEAITIKPNGLIVSGLWNQARTYNNYKSGERTIKLCRNSRRQIPLGWEGEWGPSKPTLDLCYEPCLNLFPWTWLHLHE